MCILSSTVLKAYASSPCTFQQSSEVDSSLHVTDEATESHRVSNPSSSHPWKRQVSPDSLPTGAAPFTTSPTVSPHGPGPRSRPGRLFLFPPPSSFALNRLQDKFLPCDKQGPRSLTAVPRSSSSSETISKH